MSIFFDDEAQLSGTDSGDENDNDLLTSDDLLFIDDDDTQECSPSFYRSLDLTLSPPIPLTLPLHTSGSPEPQPTSASPEAQPISASPEAQPTTRKKRGRASDAPKPSKKPRTAGSDKPKKFRLQSKGIFLTFPQCPFSLDLFFENLKTLFSHPEDQIYCSREQHEDGEWHLHAVVLLKNKLHTRNVAYFDNLVAPCKHPNIQSKLKSQSQTIAYVMKGPDDSLKRSTHPWEKFIKAAKSKRSTKSSEILKLINTQDFSSNSAVQETLQRIDDDPEHQPYLLLHLHQIRDYLQFRNIKALRLGAAQAQTIPVRVRPALTPLISSNVSIANWLNSSIRVSRPHRSHQMWIKAPPSAGKTTMISNLERWFKLRVYWWPKDEHWWDGYEDGAYDLIVLDEFKSQKKITDLNPILSGDPIPLSRRRAAPILKRDNLPVIILSNFSPEECYHKCSAQQLAPLLDRLDFIEVSNTIRIEKDEDFNSSSTTSPDDVPGLSDSTETRSPQPSPLPSAFDRLLHSP